MEIIFYSVSGYRLQHWSLILLLLLDYLERHMVNKFNHHELIFLGFSNAKPFTFLN